MTASDDSPLLTLTRSERRRERTRQAMLDVGQEVIAERGLDRLTIASITEAGDVALGSFYNHFADRDDYLRALTEQALSDWVETVRDLRPRPFNSPLERITTAILILFRRARIDQDLRVFLIEVFAKSDFPGTIEFARMFRVNLEVTKGNDTTTDDDFRLASLLIIGTVRQGLIYIGSSGGDESDPRRLTRSVLRLLGTDPELAEATLDFAEASKPCT